MAFTRLNIGKEGSGTPGTAVAATTQWRGVGGTIEDQRDLVFPEELNAIAIPTDRSYVPALLAGLSMADTPLTFEQLGYILNAGMKDVTPVQDGAGTDYISAYDVGTTSRNSIATYTLETGDNQQGEEMEYAFVTDFAIKGTAREALMMSGTWVGRQVTDSTLTSTSIPVVEDAMAGKGSVFIDAIGGTIGTTQLSNSILSMELTCTTGWRPKFFIDGNALYFGIHYFDMDSFSAQLSLTFEHDGTAVTEKLNWRNQVARMIRLQFEGSAAATGGTTYSNKTLIIDAVGKYSKFEALDSQDGNNILRATFDIKYNLTEASSPLVITLVNELTALP